MNDYTVGAKEIMRKALTINLCADNGITLLSNGFHLDLLINKVLGCSMSHERAFSSKQRSCIEAYP